MNFKNKMFKKKIKVSKAHLFNKAHVLNIEMWSLDAPFKTMLKRMVKSTTMMQGWDRD